MVEQGDMIVNTQYYDKLIERANSAIDCGEINELMAEAMAGLKAQQDAIAAKIAELQPLLALLKVPGSLSEIIKWLKTFIKNFLGPYLKPYATYVAQLALMEKKLVELIEAMEKAASRLTHCSITVDTKLPSLTLPPFDTSALDDIVIDPATTDPTTSPPTVA